MRGAVRWPRLRGVSGLGQQLAHRFQAEGEMALDRAREDRIAMRGRSVLILKIGSCRSARNCRKAVSMLGQRRLLCSMQDIDPSQYAEAD